MISILQGYGGAVNLNINADFQGYAQIKFTGLISMLASFLWLDVIIKCRLTRQLVVDDALSMLAIIKVFCCSFEGKTI